MTALLHDPNITAVLQRAGIPSPSTDVMDRLEYACHNLEGGAESILEVSQADWATEEQGTDVLVIVTRTVVYMIGQGRRGRFRPMEKFAIRAPFDYYSDLAEDDELAGPSVVFLAKDGHKPFLLSFQSAHERHRMFNALFDAHRGRFERWGLQLDPAKYVADFDRYYADIRAHEPAATEGWYDWVKQRYGEFDHANALGLAADWRRDEREDEAHPERSARVGTFSHNEWRVERHPEARRVLVSLGEELFDKGLLAPPHDERTFDIEGEPISPNDAGPSRLLALMTLAAYARVLRDPRADEWVEAARRGIPSVPPTVFSPSLRELWSDIAELPAVDDGPAPEIPIWEDADVREITSRREAGGTVTYRADTLTPADEDLVSGFLGAVSALEGGAGADPDAFIRVCLYGVSAFEKLSPLAPAGWRKLLVYVVSDLACDMQDRLSVGEPAAKLAHWVAATIEANGWGPDGRSTPLGQHHSYAWGVAVEAGVGMLRIDPATGEASAYNGDEARAAAAGGRF
jgi:hypothetical protein